MARAILYWLARFNRKMSFHFPWVVLLISDRSHVSLSIFAREIGARLPKMYPFAHARRLTAVLTLTGVRVKMAGNIVGSKFSFAPFFPKKIFAIFANFAKFFKLELGLSLTTNR